MNLSKHEIQKIKEDPEWLRKRDAQVAADDEWGRFSKCPVCQTPRSAKIVRQIVMTVDLEGWICPGDCERRWWGAADLIALFQADDARRRPTKRFGRSHLWEEATPPAPLRTKMREDDRPWWVDWKPDAAEAQARDQRLARLGGGWIRRAIRDMDRIRTRPHRMLGGRPLVIP